MNYLVGKDISDALFLTNVRHKRALSLDTETTGLLPYHGDKVFAVIVSDGEDAYYWDTRSGTFPVGLVEVFLDEGRVWYLHNAPFDLHSLHSTFGQVPRGKIHDTAVGARVEYNDHFGAKPYSLDSCAARIGKAKSDEVKKYVDAHKLKTLIPVRGKKEPYEKLHFDQVPHDIMFEYACKDALVTYDVASSQIKEMIRVGKLLPKVPSPWEVMTTERSLAPVIFSMESAGVKVDLDFCEQALAFYQDEQKRLAAQFGEITGKAYKASPLLFQEVFSDEKSLWEYTEKGNPSFKSDVLEYFESPAAKTVMAIRNAKSRTDFVAGFIFFADKNGFVHPSFKSGGTATLRFSSSEPNFQNLTNDEDSPDEKFPIRRAIIPYAQDICIVSIDFDQQEYRMMLEYAGEMPMIERVLAGIDVHQATADLVGIPRRAAKTLNFGLLYGMGVGKLAKALKISYDEAKELKRLYFSKLPMVKKFIEQVTEVAERRGYVYNWAGMRYWCPNKDFAYGMPNRVIQGGGASIMKQSMVSISNYLQQEKAASRMMLTIHDELDFYMARGEFHHLEKIKKIMETTYPSKLLPLTVSINHSWRSLGDLSDGSPQEKLAS